MLPETLEEMAADYVRLIREAQPVGPYNLLGWSFGGLVAYAIATQLQAAGQEVGLVALLDSYPYNREKTQSGDEGQDQQVLYAGTGEHPIRAIVKDILDTLRHEGHMLSTLEDEDYQAILDASMHSGTLMKAFVPQRFHGDVVLFVAAEDDVTPPIKSWRPYVGGRIDVRSIDCLHREMMDPVPAAKIGRLLAAELDKQRTTSQPHVKGERRDKSV